MASTDPPAEQKLRAADLSQSDPDEPPPHSPFPIVGIGASAGGLEAFSQLLGHLPDQPGMAFVLVQHLDPRHESHLSELLARSTRMPVLEATNGLPVEPDHVYVIPPNTEMEIARGHLRVTPRAETSARHLSVDHFMRSLAQEQRIHAIGVVLSGTGSDGTLGLCEIKDVGGITFVQDEASARHSGMPRSALDCGCADFVLAPDAIAQRLAEIGRHPYLAADPVSEEEADAEEQFRNILATVRNATGLDFSHYRDTTVRRRISRRMALHTQPSLSNYVQLLREDRSEVEALYRDLLINVTSFFRDPEMFEELRERIVPQILKDRPHSEPIRIWVPGCSTGQEAYSLAMMFTECLDGRPYRQPIQIFATDVSDLMSIEKARAGVYPETIEGELSPQRLKRFFRKEDHLYRVEKSLRDSCTFARQNLIVDPPFSHMDLISCRNVLIYMAPTLQKRVLPIFHYALNLPGFLVLGSAETVGESTDLFDPIDRAHKIYSKKPVTSRPHFHLPFDVHRPMPTPAFRANAQGPLPSDFHREADRVTLGRYAPPGVLVNENLEILQYRGRTGPYLESPPGEPTANLLKMAREGLFLDLRVAVGGAKERGAEVLRDGILVKDENGSRKINLRVIPVKPSGTSERCYLILFEEPVKPEPEGSASTEPVGADSGTSSETDRDATRLRHELSATKEFLQSLVEQQDAANEELRSANEEILSSNEELQSTNEELETAKEELQSTNEELTTVNEQLHHRNLELNLITNDLSNLLASTKIPVVMVGSDLRVRRLTPTVRGIMNLLPTDVGRPIGDINPNLDVPPLETLIAGVIERVDVVEQEVQDRDGRWWILRIHPYRTSDNKVDGAVLILLDIDRVKRAQREILEVRESRDYARAIVETVREPLVVLDEGLQVEMANSAFYRTFGVSPERTEGTLIYDLHDGQWNIPVLRRHLEEVLPEKKSFEGLEIEHMFPGLGPRTMILNARGVYRENHAALVLLAIEDVTESRARDDLRAADRLKDEFMAILAHELRNPLAPIRFALQIMQMSGDNREHTVRAQEILKRQVPQLIRIVDDLLDTATITQGKIRLRKEPVILTHVVNGAVEACKQLMESSRHQLTVTLPDTPVHLEADPARLAQIVSNLLNNAAKFTEPGGRIWLSAETVPGTDPGAKEVVISVRDTGIGIPADLLPRVFDMFTQGDRSLERSRGGLGVGLTLVKRLVQLHGGTVEARSDGLGKGSEFIVRLPGAAHAPAQAPPQPRPEAGGVGSKLRILVIDDNEDSAEMLRLTLELMGHEVQALYDGLTAVNAVTQYEPDAVFLDLGMPRLNGYEVARRIRALERGKRLTLIALTGHGQEQDKQRSAAAGFDHHLVKPVDSAALTRALSEVGVSHTP